MALKRVLVLGASGMLGSMVAAYLAEQETVSVRGTVRNPSILEDCRQRIRRAEWSLLDARDEGTWDPIDDADWIVNAIGVIKPLIHDEDAAEVASAIAVNSQFPFQLGMRAAAAGARVLQIATDCVYSGSKGLYSELDVHDALDVYGKTKSLGEARMSNVHHLRCSIVGPERYPGRSLLAWFLSQPVGSQVRGFANHLWNGLTTLHFAKLCGAIISQDIALPHLQHVIPGGVVSKAELLQAFAGAFERRDVTVEVVEADKAVNRTLATCNHELNDSLWHAAGYRATPSVAEMVAELALYPQPAAGCSKRSTS